MKQTGTGDRRGEREREIAKKGQRGNIRETCLSIPSLTARP